MSTKMNNKYSILDVFARANSGQEVFYEVDSKYSVLSTSSQNNAFSKSLNKKANNVSKVNKDHSMLGFFSQADGGLQTTLGKENKEYSSSAYTDLVVQAASKAKKEEYANLDTLDQIGNSVQSSDRIRKAQFSLYVDGLANTGLQVLSFDGVESISKPYTFEINLVNKNIRFDITKLLSRSAYLAFTPNGKKGVHGVIHSVRRGAVGADYAEYSIELTPSFKHLEKRINQRIFQHKTAPQIISQILGEFGIVEGALHEFRLREECPEREYCVQYNETDAYFIQRLCEEEGIHYHFEYTPDSHLMVFGDSQPIFSSLPYGAIYASNSGMAEDEPVIKAFDVSLVSKVTKTMWRDYNFTNTKIPEGTAVGKLNSKANQAIEPDVETYNYFGHFMNNARGKYLAQVEIERQRAQQVLAEGYSDVPILCAGYYLTVERHPSIDTKDPWLLNTVRHQGKQPQVVEAMGGDKNAKLKRQSLIDSTMSFPDGEFYQGYRNVFTATPKDTVWRPPLEHPKPCIQGSQTAKVTGPAGEEIYCDEYGRIKAQFHWDREGNFDENSSCWIRVGSNWAHKGYGSITIPRVGMEVVVAFLEGDPDQPMVTGVTNNGINALAYGLPENKTKTGFKSSSSPGGGGFNELSFDDKAGAEMLAMNAQKDMNTNVGNDQSNSVGNNQSSSVGNDESLTVANNRTKSIGQDETVSIGNDQITTITNNNIINVDNEQHNTIKNDRTVTVASGNHSVLVQTGNQTFEIASGGHALKVANGHSVTVKSGGETNTVEAGGQGNTITGTRLLTVKDGNQITKIDGELEVTVGNKITFICGASKLEMKNDGTINIEGVKFNFLASGVVKVQGSKIELN